MVSDRDKGMRGAALGILERLHAAVGAHSAWSLLGPLKDQQRSLIEERIRHRERHPDAPNLASGAAGASASCVSHWCARQAEGSRLAAGLAIRVFAGRLGYGLLIRWTLQTSPGLASGISGHQALSALGWGLRAGGNVTDNVVQYSDLAIRA